VLDFLNRQSENFAIETGENRRKEEEKGRGRRIRRGALGSNTVW
jgi:hypothetical protein